MKKVLTFGVFDLMHYGHVRLFWRCKLLGDYLIIAVQDDEHVLINKPNTVLVNNFEKRKADVLSVECVAKVVSYAQIDDDIKTIDFDILVVGPDQTNPHFVKALEWCKEHNKEVVVLPRTEGISSSQIKKEMNITK